MKILSWTILFPIVVLANTEQLKVDSSISLRSYNHRPNVQLQYKQKLRRLSKVKPEEAKQIAVKICDTDELYSQKLKHRGQLLFYRIAMKQCTVEINALDGAVISKKKDYADSKKEKREK